MIRPLCFNVICWGLFCGTIAADDVPNAAPVSQPDVVPTDAAVRAAVARSLPFLEKGGVAWMDERNCMSCHHVPFLLWSHRAAQAHGLAVDIKKLGEWENWTRKNSLSLRNSFRLPKTELEKIDAAILPNEIKEKLKPIVDQAVPTEADFLAKLSPLLTAEELKTHQALLVKTATLPLYAVDRSGGGLDVLGQLLVGGHREQGDVANAEFRNGLTDLINRMQLPDGSWTPGNQFATMRRWPLDAANQATSMWATLALAQYDAADKKRSEQIERAVAYVRQQPEQSDNHEWLATRLLFEEQFGTAGDVAKLRQQLLERRNADGGWGWSKDGPSDPFTTGLAIYVLAKVRGGDDSAVFRDARKYLLSVQQPDGSWLTPSKNITKTTVPERLLARDEIYHYWGTAWAALGLLETLPAVGK